MKKNYYILIIFCSIILILIGIIKICYVPILSFPIDELQYVKIVTCLGNGEKNTIEINEVNERNNIYKLILDSKVEKVSMLPRDDCGSDNGWQLSFVFENGMETFDSDIGIKNGCRRYIYNKDSSVKGYIDISSKELYQIIESYLTND